MVSQQRLFSVAAATVVEFFGGRFLLPQFFATYPFTLSVGIILTFNLVLLLIYSFTIYPHFVDPLRHLPGPRSAGLPILGHLFVAFERPPGRKYYKWMTEIPNDGIMSYRALGGRNLLLTSPQALSEVLVKHTYDFEKPRPARELLAGTLGEGLVVVEGDVHRFQRKNVQPTFSFKIIKGLYPMMWTKAVELTNTLPKDLQADEKGWILAEMDDWSSRATLDIIGIAGLGWKFDTLRNDDDPLVKNYKALQDPSGERLYWFAAMLTFGRSVVGKLPLKINRDMEAICVDLQRICNDLVVEKKAAVKTGSDEHVDVLSELIRSNNFSNQDLVNQLLTFLAAGHDTTASTFSWVLYLLSKRPDVQTALRKEIHDNATTIREASDLAAILESLPLLNGVCSEITRLYPTVAFTRRVATKDTRVVNVMVPEGTILDIPIWAINRMPSLWGPNALQFDPERWIDTSEDGVRKPNNHGGANSNFGLMTFLHGPRSCIGQGFARAELRVLVASFIGAYEVELPDQKKEVEEYGLVTIKPKGGLDLKIRKIMDW